MNDYLLKLIQKYKHKGLLVDTNIILLYLVGSLDILLIRDFARTAKFTEDDFYKVHKFIEYFDLQITTPHVLTEISDLIGNRKNLHNALKIYIERTNEVFKKSSEVSENKIFCEFGLADTAIIETAKDSYLIFTDDNPLYGYMINEGIDAVSLDILRISLS
ncbi:MAG: hypothetical protein ACR2IA_06115 [Pyrinomonadaceae bacterium]